MDIIAEINKVRVALFQFEFTKDAVLTLPEAEGEVVTIQEKVFVPAKEYPDVRLFVRYVLYNDTVLSVHLPFPPPTSCNLVKRLWKRIVLSKLEC